MYRVTLEYKSGKRFVYELKAPSSRKAAWYARREAPGYGFPKRSIRASVVEL